MSLNFFTIFFFLLNLYYCQNIEFDINCDDDERQYYNSLKYQCDNCNGKKSIYNDICYYDGLSIYTFDAINNFNPEICQDGIFTELDVEKKLLLEPQCASNNFNFNDVNSIAITSESNSQTAINSPITSSDTLYSYDDAQYKYYYSSCLNGNFERACDFAANLCALSLYSNTDFCEIIDSLDRNLRANGIL